ncbi:MAG: carboxypeptidase-like regulatory domain-containing protein [Saprospiraceae bacterium]|nr:carboxypeptidase-like regulatory domain-containing protein [Saprospiraceae bacterium]
MRYLNVLLLILFIPIYANAQFVIEGHVRNEKGESLSFTTVFLEETSLAASTDDKGNFNISNVHTVRTNLRLHLSDIASIQKLI